MFRMNIGLIRGIGVHQIQLQLFVLISIFNFHSRILLLRLFSFHSENIRTCKMSIDCTASQPVWFPAKKSISSKITVNFVDYFGKGFSILRPFLQCLSQDLHSVSQSCNRITFSFKWQLWNDHFSLSLCLNEMKLPFSLDIFRMFNMPFRVLGLFFPIHFACLAVMAYLWFWAKLLSLWSDYSTTVCFPRLEKEHESGIIR